MIRLFLVIAFAVLVQAGEGPRGGGTLRFARTADPQSMDPAICYDVEALFLGRLVYQGLLNFDHKMQVYAKQAKDWNVSPDQKTYTFHLRPGLRFGNGREVESEDYIFALTRIIDPKTQSPGTSFYTGIVGAKDFQEGKTNVVSGLKAPDMRTLVIELNEPDYTFTSKMAMTFASPVPRREVQAEGDAFWLHGFGTGAYRLTAWKRGVTMTFERVAEVNDVGEGYFDRVEVMIGGDRTLHAMMVERDELDAVYQIQLPDIFRLKRDPRLRDSVHMIDSAMTDFLVLNTELPPFNNIKVRQALTHAINKERLVSLMGGSAFVAKGILPPLMPGYNAALKGAEYNPELARRLLAEAGYSNGISFELSYTDDDPRWGRGAIAIEQDLSAVGARVTLIKLTLPVLYTAVQTRKRLPCAYLGWAQDYPDPSNFLDVLFNGTRIQDVGGNNFAYYNNPEVNDLLAKADRTLVANERYRLYQEIEKQILLDAPVVPLTHRATPMLISGRIDGFQPHPVWTITPECWWRRRKE